MQPHAIVKVQQQTVVDQVLRRHALHPTASARRGQGTGALAEANVASMSRSPSGNADKISWSKNRNQSPWMTSP
ncbi:MAG: hypothetical protein CM15mP128_2400 [Methanobacteriota archaeon]|nr:MAG: hypothetical protein CM15mP128_2400 [Euryarchaeota archaeon]